MDEGANIETSEVLEAAVDSADLSILRFLLETSPSIRIYGSADLKRAIRSEAVELVEFLIQQGIDVNDLDRTQTPLQSAVPNIILQKILLRAGADVNYPGFWDSERTALQEACWKGSLESINLLLSAGADVNVPACYKNGWDCPSGRGASR